MMMDDISCPSEKLAEIARWSVRRDDWDMYAEFMTLNWDSDEKGEMRLSPGTVAVMAGDIDPSMYPKVMAQMALKVAADDGIGKAACAYMLCIEGWAVTEPLADASDEEKARFQHDRENGLFHTRDDKREMKTAIVANLRGQVWMANRQRGSSDVSEAFHEYGDPDLTGRMPEGLVRVARMMGTILRASLYDGES